MPRLFLGDVIEVLAPAGPDKFKHRPVIVLRNCKSENGIIAVYCTSQNNGDDVYALLVAAESQEGTLMGLTKDTWIRPGNILNLPGNSFVRKIGTCGLILEIERIIDLIKAR
jgi:hypothetical protein